MTYRAAQQALDRLHHQVIALNPNAAMRLQSSLETLATMTMAQGEAAMAEVRKELTAAYGGDSEVAEKPFAFANGLAVIPIHGSLLNRFSGSYGSATGYDFIRRQFRAAMADDDVKGIVFDVNSHGGEAAGCFELADEIRAGRDTKPSLAMVDSNCYSAAYALSSAASKIAITKSSGVGSIGVLVMHADVSEALSNFGVKISLIHSGAHKVDGNPFEPLPDAVRADIQTSIDEMRGEFVTTVATNRSMEEKAVSDTEAKTYRGQKAVGMGLADEVNTVQNAVSGFFNALSGATTTLEQSAMTTQAQAVAPVTTDATAAAPVDVQAALAAERARCNSITSCEQAKGREALANHLAFNTSMSVEDAQAALAAAPAAAPAAAGSNLDAAMAGHTANKPLVPAGDSGASAEEGSQEAILAQFDTAWSSATGRKVNGAK